MHAERALIDDRGLEWPNLVQASDLRPGFLHRIRGAAATGFAQAIERGRAADASEAEAVDHESREVTEHRFHPG